MTRSPLSLVAGILAIGAGTVAACAPSEHTFTIAAVTPRQAYTDAPVVLRVAAGGLRPALNLNLESGTVAADWRSVRTSLIPNPRTAGATPVQLKTIDWDRRNPEVFWVEIPPQLALGRYDLELVDPRGDRTTHPDAFEALGPDPAPPAITVEPALGFDGVVTDDTPPTSVVVDDLLGLVANVHWETSHGTSGDCQGSSSPGVDSTGAAELRILPSSRVACLIDFAVPKLGESDPPVVAFNLHAEGTDAAGHQVVLDLPLRFVRAPTVVSFAGTLGGLAGHQPFVVRGRDFMPGAYALLDGVPILGAVPGGEIRDDDGGGGQPPGYQMIVGLTPPRPRAGPVKVQIRSPAGTAQADGWFNYIAPPLPRDLQPATGPTAGGTQITLRGNDLRGKAVVYAGPSRENRQPLYNLRYDADNKIVACMPPGTGVVTIWVEDAITGEGSLPDAYTYTDGATVGGAHATAIVANNPACR